MHERTENSGGGVHGALLVLEPMKKRRWINVYTRCMWFIQLRRGSNKREQARTTTPRGTVGEFSPYLLPVNLVIYGEH